MNPRALLAGALAFALPALAAADSGVLTATGGKPGDLSLRSMRAHAEIDGAMARTRVVQVYQNETDRTLEGRYVFRLPVGSSLADFALWEDGVRIPGVVLERRRAQRIYEELKAQAIDPGLVESADPGGEDVGLFAARVFPIPPRGTKRIEIELSQELAVAGREGRYVLPLAPDRFAAQRAAELELSLDLAPAWPLESAATENSRWGAIEAGDDGHYRVRFTGKDVDLDRDLAVRFRVRADAPPWEVLVLRDPRHHHRFQALGGGAFDDPDGFLLVRYLLPQAEGAQAPPPPKRWLLLADLSLSVQWEKLEALAAAVRHLAGAVEAPASFDLAVFQDGPPEVLLKEQAGGAPGEAAAAAALHDRALLGGTDLEAASRFAGDWLRGVGSGGVAVLLSDGHPTRGEATPPKIREALGAIPAGARLLTLGIGRGARGPLLEELASAGRGYHDGLDEHADPAYTLERFTRQVGLAPVEGARLEWPEGLGIDRVYPETQPPTFAGSAVRWIGRYRAPKDEVPLHVRFRQGGEAREATRRVKLPGHGLEHPQLPRVWARARVDHLLARIDAEGEKDEWVDEIVRLAKAYKLATPYTSFLAAPRALLRPRFIKPGDPVLRVKTRPGVTRVTALLPWGELLPLRELPDEGVFEGRFLAPGWVEEGRHAVRLVMAGEGGERLVLDEHFRLDGTPPTVRIRGELPAVHPGDRLALAVFADADTRSITARLPGGAPVALRYQRDGHVSTGLLPIPDLPPGRYELHLEAEDFAHNRSSQTWILEVRG